MSAIVDVSMRADDQQMFSACVANGGAAWDHSALVRALELMADTAVGA